MEVDRVNYPSTFLLVSRLNSTEMDPADERARLATARSQLTQFMGALLLNL